MTLKEIMAHRTEYAPAFSAWEKMGSNPLWFPFYYEAQNGGLIVKGAILKEISRGKNKGQMTSRGCCVDTVIISINDIDDAEKLIRS